MKLTQLQTKAIEIVASFPGRAFDMPKIEFATASDLGRQIDGRFLSQRNLIWLRRRPAACDIDFLLAHELAHAWQQANGLPFDEDQADRMAMNAVRYSHFNLPCNQLKPGEML